MTEKEFWKCTPKKLGNLVTVYMKQNAVSEPSGDSPQSEQKAKFGYIDSIF